MAMDWTQVPVAEDDAQQREIDLEGSVLSPTYRQRSILGGQEIGGLGGSIVGSVLGVPFGPAGVLAGSAIGAGLGGAGGEYAEQVLRDEPFSARRVGEAGVEEALWDAGGNLVFKAAGKVFKVAGSAMFSKDKVPDATKAAQLYLEKQGSSLPKAAMFDSGVLESAQSLVTTPITSDIFKGKEDEIRAALMSGRSDILNNFTKSPEFDAALKQGRSPQRASGEVLQSFIRNGEQALSDSVSGIYKNIFADKNSTVSLFSVKTWADSLLAKKGTLTTGQETILKDIKNLPTQADINTLHEIRSRWLAESRDKYSEYGTAKDRRSVSTISDLVSKLDEATDFAASRTLDPKTLAEYKKVTKSYREGIQGLHTDAIVEAMTKNPEEVGGYLFAAGKETPVNELYKAISTAQKLSGKSSKEVIDALRYGYLEALTTTPENMLKFADNLERNAKLRNTFNVLFDPQQQEAIKAMNAAAQKGLVRPHTILSSTSRGTQAVYGLGQAAALGAGYAFLLSPEQQERIKENLGETAVAAGALILNQRALARLLLDPKGPKTLTALAKAREKLTNPSAFTKLVVEPLANIYKEPSPEEDLANFLTGGKGTTFDWNAVPSE